MKVENFKIEKWISGLTTAELSGIVSYKLYINDICITENLPEIEFEDALLQIDVCTECFYVGCSSGGYVQVLIDNDIVIWKEPLLANADAYEECQYGCSYGLKYGTIFWSKELFKNLLNCYNIQLDFDNEPFNDKISVKQAKDLWRIYGSKCLQPKSIGSYSIGKLEENFLAYYSDKIDDEECFELFKRAKKDWNKARKANLVYIPENAEKVTVIFDVIDGYREWDFIYKVGERVLYPVGDNFMIELEV